MMTQTNDRHGTKPSEEPAQAPDERVDAGGLERMIDDTRDFLDARPTPDLSAVVMRRVAEIGPLRAPEARGLIGSLRAAFWRPRSVSFEFRPAYVLAAAVVVIGAFIAVSGSERSTGDAAHALVTPVADDARLLVQFNFLAPDASSVQLVGSFSDWEPRHPLVQTSPGHWTVTLPLSSGVYDYGFLVNGQTWVPDPFAPTVRDGFGGVNSRLAVLAPGDVSL